MPEKKKKAEEKPTKAKTVAQDTDTTLEATKQKLLEKAKKEGKIDQ